MFCIDCLVLHLFYPPDLADNLDDKKRIELDLRARELAQLEEECRRAKAVAVADFNRAQVLLDSPSHFSIPCPRILPSRKVNVRRFCVPVLYPQRLTEGMGEGDANPLLAHLFSFAPEPGGRGCRAATSIPAA